jgi:U3 small nucleolar RNA-associated protein 21
LIQIWDFETAHVLDVIPINSPVTALRFRPESDLLAVVSDDLCIRVVDVDTRKIVRELWGHSNRITDLVKISKVRQRRVYA